MRILYITPYYKPSWFYGGPPKCIAEQAEYLVKHHQLHIEVLTLNWNGDQPLFDSVKPLVKEVDGVTVHYLPISNSKFGKGYFNSEYLHKYLEKFLQYDLIHVNTLFNAFSRKGMRFAYKNHIPYIVTPHGMLDAFSLTRSKRMKKIHRLLFDDKLLSAAQVVHFTTHNEEKNSIINKPIHPVIIPIGFEFSDEEIKKKSTSDGKLRLIFLGRINRKKGIDILAKGLAGTEKSISSNVQVDIYGADDDNCKAELEILIHELNLQNNFTFCGSLDPKDRDEKLRNYDALVLTSHQENFGLVVAEALAQALPVYISDKVNLCDFVLENKCGWISSLQVNAIAKTLSEIFRIPVHKKNEMGLNGYKAVHKYFSMKEVAGKYAELYQKIISKTHL